MLNAQKMCAKSELSVLEVTKIEIVVDVILNCHHSEHAHRR